jgi:hypothetical protein
MAIQCGLGILPKRRIELGPGDCCDSGPDGALVKTKRSGAQQNKRLLAEGLMKTLARQVGRAAGEIVKAAQSLAPHESSASSDVPTKNAPLVRRSASKKQKKHSKRKGRRRIATIKTGGTVPDKKLKTERRTS